MVAGIGMDLIEVSRVAEKIGREAGFKELIFSPNEIAYCETKANKHQHYAARFAAKEAFYKAIGTGWLQGTQFNEIELTHDALGKPLLTFIGNTQKVIGDLALVNILVSLCHIKETAGAVVIIER